MVVKKRKKRSGDTELMGVTLSELTECQRKIRKQLLVSILAAYPCFRLVCSLLARHSFHTTYVLCCKVLLHFSNEIFVGLTLYSIKDPLFRPRWLGVSSG